MGEVPLYAWIPADKYTMALLRVSADSIIAVRVIVTEPMYCDGIDVQASTCIVSPDACTALNLDFDGDNITGVLPFTDEGKKRCTLPKRSTTFPRINFTRVINDI